MRPGGKGKNQPDRRPKKRRQGREEKNGRKSSVKYTPESVSQISFEVINQGRVTLKGGKKKEEERRKQPHRSQA